MRQVTKYEANDGTLFDFRDQAVAHEGLMKLQEWYDTNRMTGKYHDPVEWREFLEYLQNNRGKVREILDVCSTLPCENRSA